MIMKNGRKTLLKYVWGIAMLLFLFPMGAKAQNVNITGNVTDDTGQPIIGASVKISGGTTGAVTDMDGNFTLSVPENSKLKISYVGYKDKYVIAKSGKMSISLIEDTNVLNEVVAIGYGTAKRKDVTGSVSSVSNTQLVSVPVASPLEAMQGKLAGVRVTVPEGNPDAEVIIRVRGGGSITRDNTPLYIVDGFPVTSISDIPTSDIESIDVLKDASSTAIYGSRGANGIILVTTKSGKAGKVQVNYNAYVGFKNAENKVKTLELEDYLKWQYELSLMSSGSDYGKFQKVFGNWNSIPELSQTLEEKDWQNIVFGRTGNVFSHNLNISGGSEKLRFNVGYNYMKEKEILLTSDFNRNNLNMKLNYEPNKKSKLEFSARYSRTKVYGDGQGDTSGDQNSAPSSSFGRIRHSIVSMPFVVDLTTLGSDVTEADVDDGLEDPITALNDNYKKRIREELNMNGAWTWNILSELIFRTDVGLDIYNNDLDYFYGTTTYESKNNAQAAYQNMPLTNHTQVAQRTFRNSNTLQYSFSKLLPKDHSLNLMLGQEDIVSKESLTTTRVEGFPTFYDANMAFRFSSQGTPTRANEYYYPDDKMISFFSRLNYDYLERYLLTTTIRADGSSKFTKNHRWGYFPSIAGGWRITEEPWMKSTKGWLSNLKLRLSYGVTGNNNIPSGQTSRTYAITQSSWLNTTSSWLSAGTAMNNPDLKWETTHSVNLGLDFGFFNNKLNGSLELYKNNVKDLLMEMQITGSGYNTQYQNIGETQNKGVELSLNYDIINRKNYGMNISFTMSHNTNKVISLGSMGSYTKASYWASTEVGADYIIKPGLPVGTIIGYQLDGTGRYETSDFTSYENGKYVLKKGIASDASVVGSVRPGALKLKDQNGDGVINDDDKVKIGDANAWATGGFSINANFYNFDFNADFTYSLGNDIYNADKIDQTSTRGTLWHNLSSIMAEGKRWTNIDANGNLITDLTALSELNANTTMWSPYTTKAVCTDWAIEDGSFLRLSTITLGYTFPPKIMNKLYIQNFRLYLTASNLFCLTNYSGMDPEVDCKRNYLICPGVDYSAYPRSRQFIIGINLTF
ncbi:MAG: TonB-dependent receptor [Prevotella sp.]|jgi:TonB-linked SusC/RagA family outer membrane protein|nr:TonB-dependent receptor [Prevotella sp.]MCH3992312.1 TonB-dependent receptor [Prevotella sp.]